MYNNYNQGDMYNVNILTNNDSNNIQMKEEYDQEGKFQRILYDDNNNPQIRYSIDMKPSIQSNRLSMEGRYFTDLLSDNPNKESLTDRLAKDSYHRTSVGQYNDAIQRDSYVFRDSYISTTTQQPRETISNMQQQSQKFENPLFEIKKSITQDTNIAFTDLLNTKNNYTYVPLNEEGSLSHKEVAKYAEIPHVNSNSNGGFDSAKPSYSTISFADPAKPSYSTVTFAEPSKRSFSTVTFAEPNNSLTHAATEYRYTSGYPTQPIVTYVTNPSVTTETPIAYYENRELQEKPSYIIYQDIPQQVDYSFKASPSQYVTPNTHYKTEEIATSSAIPVHHYTTSYQYEPTPLITTTNIHDKPKESYEVRGSHTDSVRDSYKTSVEIISNNPYEALYLYANSRLDPKDHRIISEIESNKLPGAYDHLTLHKDSHQVYGSVNSSFNDIYQNHTQDNARYSHLTYPNEYGLVKPIEQIQSNDRIPQIIITPPQMVQPITNTEVLIPQQTQVPQTYQSYAPSPQITQPYSMQVIGTNSQASQVIPHQNITMVSPELYSIAPQVPQVYTVQPMISPIEAPFTATHQNASSKPIEQITFGQDFISQLTGQHQTYQPLMPQEQVVQQQVPLHDIFQQQQLVQQKNVQKPESQLQVTQNLVPKQLETTQQSKLEQQGSQPIVSPQQPINQEISQKQVLQQNLNQQQMPKAQTSQQLQQNQKIESNQSQTAQKNQGSKQPTQRSSIQTSAQEKDSQQKKFDENISQIPEINQHRQQQTLSENQPALINISQNPNPDLRENQQSIVQQTKVTEDQIIKPLESSSQLLQQARQDTSSTEPSTQQKASLHSTQELTKQSQLGEKSHSHAPAIVEGVANQAEIIKTNNNNHSQVPNEQHKSKGVLSQFQVADVGISSDQEKIQVNLSQNQLKPTNQEQPILNNTQESKSKQTQAPVDNYQNFIKMSQDQIQANPHQQQQINQNKYNYLNQMQLQQPQEPSKSLNTSLQQQQQSNITKSTKISLTALNSNNLKKEENKPRYRFCCGQLENDDDTILEADWRERKFFNEFDIVDEFDEVEVIEKPKTTNKEENIKKAVGTKNISHTKAKSIIDDYDDDDEDVMITLKGKKIEINEPITEAKEMEKFFDAQEDMFDFNASIQDTTNARTLTNPLPKPEKIEVPPPKIDGYYTFLNFNDSKPTIIEPENDTKSSFVQKLETKAKELKGDTVGDSLKKKGENLYMKMTKNEKNSDKKFESDIDDEGFTTIEKPEIADDEKFSDAIEGSLHGYDLHDYAQSNANIGNFCQSRILF